LAEMRAVEYRDLDTVRAMPGGAAFFIGKHLWDGFGRRSFFFSHIGRGDVFSKNLGKQMKDMPWVRGDHITTSNHAQCAVSMQLLDRSGTPLPTFTHRGALAELSWTRILKDVQHTLRKGGGVLVISGYFRTDLCVDLDRSIAVVSPDVLVVLDHGRFHANDNEPALRSLIGAFKSGTVDIYICTYSELVEVARGVGTVSVKEVDTLSEIAVLRRMMDGGILPRVTVVRGDAKPGMPAALVAFDKHVELIKNGPVDWQPKGRPGSKNSFTAAFIDHLYTGRESTTEEAIRAAVSAALVHWSESD